MQTKYAEREKVCMFNMEHTGTAISKARKAKGLTQMEFADKLNISFQAVSNWERGISMPDISKLPEIAEILQISIDELLGKKAPLINRIINEGDEYLKNNEINQEEVTEAAPLLKPEQVDKAFKSSALSSKVSEIENFLPFLSTEACDELFKKSCAENDLSTANKIAPFASYKVIDEEFFERIRTGKSITGLLPFVSDETLEQTAWEAYEIHGVKAAEKYFPFIRSSALSEIAEAEYKKNGLRNFAAIAPFLSSKDLNNILKKVLE